MKIEGFKKGQTVFVKGIITDIEKDEILDLEVHTSENNIYVSSRDAYVSVWKPKPEVPQVALEYYEEFKNVLTSFDEWFGDFYSDKFDLEKYGELQIWLYDNNNKTSLQRELALATLIVNGPDAVTIQKERLYNVSVLGCTLFKMTADDRVFYKLIGENETPSESVLSLYKFEENLTEKEIKQADERLWQFAKSAF